MVWSLRSDCDNNILAFSSGGHFPRQCHADSAGLTMEEAIEFEALDALPPFDDSGNIAWSFEGGPTTPPGKTLARTLFEEGGVTCGRTGPLGSNPRGRHSSLTSEIWVLWRQVKNAKRNGPSAGGQLRPVRGVVPAACGTD